MIPVGVDRYALYYEHPPEPEAIDAPEAPGWLGWLRAYFTAVVRTAEAHSRDPASVPPPTGRLEHLQRRMMGWVVERMAEQRLLWTLRRETAVDLMYPSDLSGDEAVAVVRRSLREDHDRHRRWLVVDGLLLVASGLLAIVPGPNVIAYYFVFRVGGHWLCLRGADQGLHRIAWGPRACEPLVELRSAVGQPPPERGRLVTGIAERLGLLRLPAFVERVTSARA